MTPLHMACTHGNLEVAKMLISKGAQLRCCDEENNTPLLVACTEGHIKLVQLLFAAGENQGILGQVELMKQQFKGLEAKNMRQIPISIFYAICLTKAYNVLL